MRNEKLFISLGYLVGFMFGGWFGLYLTITLPFTYRIILAISTIVFFGEVVGRTVESIYDKLSELEEK